MGAHVGYFAIMGLALHCSVISFEANPLHHPLLQFSATVNGFEDEFTLVPRPASDLPIVEFNGWSTAAFMIDEQSGEERMTTRERVSKPARNVLYVVSCM